MTPSAQNQPIIHMKTKTIENTAADRVTASLRRRLLAGLIGLSAVFTVFTSVGCQNMNPPPEVPAEASVSRPSSNLAAGDEISISFSGAPEMNTDQKVQPNGKVSLPTIGDVSAAGKSITSFQAQLTSRYQEVLQDPMVVVSMKNAAAGVYVSGEVLNPSKVVLDRPLTALEAVMEAGGFTKFANPKQVIVMRNSGGKTHRYVLNMKNTLKGIEGSPFYVRAYDVIYVSQSKW